MTPLLLNWMLLSTFCLGGCWLFYYLLLRREPLFQYNRAYLLLTPLLAGVLPLLPLSAWLSPVRELTLAPALQSELWLPAVQIGTRGGGAAVPWLLWLYAGGVGVSVAWRLGQLLHLRHRIRRLPGHAHAGYIVRLTGGRLPISTFGRTVLWDETLRLTETHADYMLAHELAHVRLGHTADRLWLQLWQSVLWFNPFIWLYARALALTHEYQADAAAVGSSASPAATYTELLAWQTVATAGFSLPGAHSFTASHTLNRIAMLHRTHSARPWKRWLPLPLLGLLLGIVACEKADQPGVPSAPAVAAVTAPLNAQVSPAPGLADQMPEYDGGINQLMRDLQGTTVYPTIAQEAKLEGRVYVNFTVATDGSVQAAKVMFFSTATDKAKQNPESIVRHDAHAQPTPAQLALEQAALEAVRQLPRRWTPGQHNGQPVAVAYTIPIVFALKHALSQALPPGFRGTLPKGEGC